VTIVGCGSGASSGSGRPSASTIPSAATATLVPLDRWRSLGATEAPPANIQQVSLQGIEVVNQTQGAVSEPDAHRWAEAFMRTGNYELWAFNALQDGFLTQGGISKAPTVAFRYDLDWIARARARG
jgi:hypothetical protein